MKWVLVMLICTLCTSCVMRGSDSFVTAGGLQDIQSRQDLFARDVQMGIALTGAHYDQLSAGIRTCLVNHAVDHAAPELLASADGFLLHKSEASWQKYRRESGDGFDAGEIQSMMRACESSAYQIARS